MSPPPARGGPAGAAPGTAVTDLPGYRVVVAMASAPADVPGSVARLTDPGAAQRTLHWGRNYLYTMEIATAAGTLEVVVKQFRNHGLGARLRRRWTGSKAEKSWHVARELHAAGFATPEPVALIESHQNEGPSFYVSRYLEHDFEVRYYFRALNAGREAEAYPGVPADRLLGGLGREIRRLHDAGFWHRDLSAGNILVCRGGQAGDALRFHFVDLNRVRTGRRMSAAQRSRGLCRLPIRARRHQMQLLAAYWGGDPGASRRWLYLASASAFAWRNRAKQAVRGPLRAVRDLLIGRRPHAHIPAAPAGASARDKVVWDALSDQPHQHAGRFERLRVRLGDSGEHAAATSAALTAAPAAWRLYRRLEAQRSARPVPWGLHGIAVRPWERDPEGLLSILEDLGLRRVLLRLHPWQRDHRAEEELARELAGRGFELAFALPQVRELVRDPGAWRSAVAELAERFLPWGRQFQIGQAINRSKWGIWSIREYLEMAAAASEILRRRGAVEILGPAVIDFEPAAMAAALNLRHAGVRFDIVSALLYVDRRGAPENRQLGFDTADKVTLLAALARTARNAISGRCWITEVNWPLQEGPHAPAGRHVAVDEHRQADYLVRYYLLALGTGLVERVYWWQAIARGYGLVDPQEDGVLRRRPSFLALATLERELAGATLLGPCPAPEPARLWGFSTADGGAVAVGWSAGAPAKVRLPAAALAVVGRDGEERELTGEREVEVGASPRYWRLDPSAASE